MARPNSDFVQLKDGPILSAGVISFAVDMETKGFRFRADAQSGRLFVSSLQNIGLSGNETEFIKKHKIPLLVVVQYCEDHK